jgi:hypothetical protein
MAGGRHKLVELPLIPGALTDDTDRAAALHAIDMDKTRFRGNRAQTILGWTSFNASGMSAGTARALHTYADLNGTPIVIAASESAVNAWKGGTRYDITPKWRDVWIHHSQILVTAGVAQMNWGVYSPSSNTYVLAPHNLQVGDQITISGCVRSVAGSVDLNGTWTIGAVTGPYTIAFTVPAGTNPNPTFPFTVTVPFRAGLATGTGDTPATRARIPSIDNFGEDAVFCFSDGSPVFMWEGNTSTSNVVVNGDFSVVANWTSAGGWGITGGRMRHTGNVQGTTFQDVTNTLEGGKLYEMSFTVATYATALTLFQVMVNSIDIFPLGFESAPTTLADAQRTYTFRFVCPANPTQLKFVANGTSAGVTNIEIDDVSISQLMIAAPINEAPQKNYALFTDQNRILTTLGSVEADGDFNALLVRWSDQDNLRMWVPDTDNVAGEFPLGKGSIAIAGKQCGSVNLILTDDPAYVASFNGDGYSFRLVGEGCGACGAQSLAINNNRAMWASPNGFFGFDGAQVLMIECPLKDRYVGKLATFQANKTYAWSNTQFGEVWFHYAHTSDGTEISRYVIFNYLEQGNPWAFGTFDRTCWTRASIYPNPIAIDVNDAIWTHETGNAMPGSITLPLIETGYVVGEAGDQWLGIRRYYPDVETQVGNITWTVTGKRAPQGAGLTRAISKTLLVDQTKVDFLIDARQFKFKWASAASPTFWRLGIVGLEMRAQKERR